jgi:hypothetical protein
MRDLRNSLWDSLLFLLLIVEGFVLVVFFMVLGD